MPLHNVKPSTTFLIRNYFVADCVALRALAIGATLLDYRPRKDEALERGYMKGRYGAVPMVGKISG